MQTYLILILAHAKFVAGRQECRPALPLRLRAQVASRSPMPVPVKDRVGELALYRATSYLGGHRFKRTLD
jgi:hypothetical protein